MSERAVDLLNLPADKSCLLLDIGCGSGLSGEVISDRGHTWVGLDISPSMLGAWLVSLALIFHPILFQYQPERQSNAMNACIAY
jgi:SAM-dependent methyltransferase